MVSQVGTHGPSLHNNVKRALLEGGFILERELGANPNTAACDETARTGRQTLQACLVESEFGPIYVRDGLLGFANPRLTTVEGWEG